MAKLNKVENKDLDFHAKREKIKQQICKAQFVMAEQTNVDSTS